MIVAREAGIMDLLCRLGRSREAMVMGEVGGLPCSHSKSRIGAIRVIIFPSTRSRLRFALAHREGALGMHRAGWLSGLRL